jgi:ketosteroid isomerase-like protein
MINNFGAVVCARHFMAAVLIFAISCGAVAAQKSQKKNKNQPADTTDQSMAALSLPVAQQVDTVIGEMLGAFQLGDMDMMHKYYADNATFVSGVYEPPVVGWVNYLPLYKSGMAGFEGIQVIRRNTYIFNRSDVAWAMYQWEFLSTFNGKPYSAEGQTTLVLNKVGDKWLIVHNHTSQVQPPAPVQQSAEPSGTPQQPPTQNSHPSANAKN